MSQSPTVPPFVNSMMKTILRSPLHNLVSKSVLLISFAGKRSGNLFTTPVSYSQVGDQITIFTHATWWKNLDQETPVTLRLRGKDIKGYPQAVSDDKLAIAEKLAEHLTHVPSDAQYYAVKLDETGRPNMDQVKKAVESVVMIRVSLC